MACTMPSRGMQFAAFANALHAQRCCCPPRVPPRGITLLESGVTLTRSQDAGYADATKFDTVYELLIGHTEGVAVWPPGLEELGLESVGEVFKFSTPTGTRDTSIAAVAMYLVEDTILEAAPGSIGLDTAFAETNHVAYRRTPTGAQWVYGYDHATVPVECRALIQANLITMDGGISIFDIGLGRTIVSVEYTFATRRAVVRRSTVLGVGAVSASTTVEVIVVLPATAFTMGCYGDRRTYGLDRVDSTLPNTIARGATDRGTSMPLLKDGELVVTTVWCGVYTGDLTIATEDDLATYQFLCEIDGSLVIGGTFTNLDAKFPHLRTVTGSLSINDTALTTLGTAFSNLTTVGGSLSINNTALTTLGAAFPALTTVGDYLDIHANAALTTLSTAFSSLTTVGGGLSVAHGALATMGTAFSRLTTLGGNLFVAYNGALANLGMAFTAQRMKVGGAITIEYNGLPPGPGLPPAPVASGGTINMCLSGGGSVESWEVAVPNDARPTTC